MEMVIGRQGIITVSHHYAYYTFFYTYYTMIHIIMPSLRNITITQKK